MLPLKIELTEEIVSIIRKVRLEHPINGQILTAENISKAIGKNRAWMSQIESRRLKKIRREDVISLFELLYECDEKNAEAYAEYELFSPDDTDALLDKLHYKKHGLQIQNDEESFKLDLKDLCDIINKEYNVSNSNSRNRILDTINNMIENLMNDPWLTFKLYGVNLYENVSIGFAGERPERYHNELNACIEYFSNRLSLIQSKEKVYSFISSDSVDSIGHMLSNYDNGGFETLNNILFTIEQYIFAIYDYCNKSYKYDSTNSIEYNKLYSMMTRFFDGFINIAKLNCTYKFDIPKDDSTLDELVKKHIESNNILFQIKQVFHMTYK